MAQQLAREQGITLRGSAEIVAEFFCEFWERPGPGPRTRTGAEPLLGLPLISPAEGGTLRRPAQTSASWNGKGLPGASPHSLLKAEVYIDGLWPHSLYLHLDCDTVQVGIVGLKIFCVVLCLLCFLEDLQTWVDVYSFIFFFLLSAFGINSILYQRGIYPSETFTRVQKYGLTLLVTTDPELIKYLNNVVEQLKGNHVWSFPSSTVTFVRVT